MSEDEEPQGHRKASHIMDKAPRTKSLEKRNSSLKHLQFFINNHFEDKVGVSSSNLIKGKDVYKLRHQDFSDDLMGKFCDYLANDARSYFDPKRDLLSWQTVQGYFSSVKMYCIRKFHDKGIPLCLQDGMTKQYNALMLSAKTDYVVRNGKSLYGSKEKASDEDIMSFTTICFWNGDLKSAEFLHLFKSAIDNVGRCSEIAVLTWEKVFPTSIPRPGIEKVFQTVQVDVNRLKTQHVRPGEDKIVHFVHVDDFSKCYIFIMFYHLVLDADRVEQTNHIFPSWYGAVTSADNSTHESKVAAQFKEFWSKIANIAKSYVDGISDVDHDEFIADFHFDEMTESRGAHSAKKWSVQYLGDAGLVPQDISARAGWAMRNFNTFFDYWNGTALSQRKSGLVMAGWGTTTDIGIKCTKGQPPNLDSITTNRDKLHSFRVMLIGHRPGLHRTLKNILLANCLRFYDDFITFLMKEPNGKYKTMELIASANPFVNKVNNARQQIGIDDEMFEQWKSLIKKDFYLANCWAVPEFQLKLGATPLASFPPTFTLGDYIVGCEQRNQGLIAQQQELFTLVRKREEENNDLRKRLCTMETMLSEMYKVVCPSSGDTREDLTNPDPLSSNESPNILIAYTSLSLMWSKSNSFEDKVYMFVNLNFEKSYEQNSTEDKKKLKYTHSKRRTAIKNFLSIMPEKFIRIPSVLLEPTAIQRWRTEFKSAIVKWSSLLTAHLRIEKVLKINASITCTCMAQKGISECIARLPRT